MTASVNFYADFKGLAALKHDATTKDPKALREAARQFESLFTQMMLKSMRDAGNTLRSGDSLTENDQTDFYQEMFDNQMATQLSKGKGLGLADMLMKQLASGPKASPSVNSDSKLGHPQDAPSLPRPSQLPKSRQLSLPTANSLQLNLSSIVASQAAAGGGRTDAQGVTPPAAIPPSTGAIEEAHVDAFRITNNQAPSSEVLATTPDQFVAQLWPHAEAVARELGVDPRMLIAHAALETGWGKHVPCNPDGTCSFNLFGIKAGSRWQGASVGVNTVEFENGVAVQRRASFRAYGSPAESFRDYAQLIRSSPRYAAALGTGNDAAAFANALQAGGYATDPNYASKLTAVAERLHPAFKVDASQPLAVDRRVSTGSGEQT